MFYLMDYTDILEFDGFMVSQTRDYTEVQDWETLYASELEHGEFVIEQETIQ